MITPKLKTITHLFSRLPGVGEKTAQRYVLYLLATDPEIARGLATELAKLHDEIRPCEACGNLAEVDGRTPLLCAVCRDDKRDATVLCVVARVHDLLAIERTGTMRGRYFVLGKLLSPLEGVGPLDLPIPRLKTKIANDGVREVIVATPPSVDGEATALLLKRELEPTGISLSRIASGVPHGGDLEFADPITMGRALSGRQRL